MQSKTSIDMGINFLVVENDPVALRQLQGQLNKSYGDQYRLTHVQSGKEAVRILRQNPHDVILADITSLSDIAPDLEQAMAKICRLCGSALVIALSTGSSVSCAVDTMRAGAHDYMTKPINARAFESRISELGQRHGHARALSSYEKPGQPQFEGFIGASAQMKEIYQQIERIAPSSAPVFITGESGSGKEVCAQALHQRSPRADKPFIAINCSAIPHDLMEGEIFGVTKGAYTGADKNRAGAAEMAEGGILFLDEIGELDLALQAKLLRFLQTGTITRVGETRSRRVDVRIICATNCNPMQLISEKKFREDLFYRLHVLPIHLPPLRQRPCDILPLANAFLSLYAQEENKSFSGFSTDTANLIVSREWPGNVRQLQNIIRRMVVMFEGPEISTSMLSAADIETRHINMGASKGRDTHEPTKVRAIEPMWKQEQKIIENALDRYNGNISLAAAALEISPSTIYRKKQAWEQMQAETIGANAFVA